MATVVDGVESNRVGGAGEGNVSLTDHRSGGDLRGEVKEKGIRDGRASE